MTPIEEKLSGYIGGRLVGEQTPPVDADLLSSGMVDSLGMMWLVTRVEEEFAIRIPPEDFTIEHFGSIRSIGEYISKRVVE